MTTNFGSAATGSFDGGTDEPPRQRPSHGISGAAHQLREGRGNASLPSRKKPPDEQALWDEFIRAFHQFEGHPTELNRARVIVRFTAWSMAFSPDTSIADAMVLRSRLKVGR